ncbi:peptidogycan-associated lipoprotein [Alcanivorax balearicus MACL04]|uniref:Peptidoglycan-associated lipoprotein n=1 Tax=Alloalcanivorax balearicus MACL04 TaxID=1177182 RepID=A0ABT2QVJ3_9GAMM|nr:peptidoglycan-associated lipoprotein Pal [Alloalcanivorax balearicus]MCU5781548.1 peptidogycan-associated lipoprotein [Alloalcanivorax balearicus MACL04]
MRSFVNPLFAVILAGVLAACSSTPTEQDTSATDTSGMDSQTGTTQPVQRPESTRPDTSSVPLTADNFHNHPSNYDGTTDTRVIYFAFDSNTVPAAAFESLRAHATYLKNNANAKLRLEGHADERGTREYNVALSERRAQAVQKFLRVQGVSSSQLEVVSYGEEKPAAFGHSEMDWAKNRRVELNYVAGRP